MRSTRPKDILKLSLSAVLLSTIVWTAESRLGGNDRFSFNPTKSAGKIELVAPADTVDLPLPHGEDSPTPYESTEGVSLGLPENIQYSVEYDPETGNYNIVQSVGDAFDFRPGSSMTLDEYLEYDMQKNISEFWQERQEEEDEQNREWAPKLKVGGETFANIFGSNEIEIRPQGSAELTFGVNISKQDNPRIPERQRRISTFDFQQRIQLNVVGNIGTKLKLTTNYNTEATFDFENQMKLEYTGEEDEIIKKIEAGNVSLPLTGSLIQGSQSLFGIKMETQFGRLRNTTVFSQQKGERREIEVSGGAQTQIFEITADNYEQNRHYFLSQYFRETYDQSMSSLPVVNSGVNITRIEVWVVNNQANTMDVRNIIGFTDLGEHPDYISPELPVSQLIDDPNTAVIPQRYPDNEGNDIFRDMVTNPNVIGFTNANQAIAALGAGYTQGVHYERVGNARKLNPSEYTFNSRLGFVSLRQALNNAEVLAVAYEYTLNGNTYQVGTLSQDGIAAPDALILKMLKSSITQVTSANGETAPLWDLMMKNVYNIGAFGVSRENFRLDVWYNNPATGVDMNYIPRNPLDGKMLLQLLNMDRLDMNFQSYPDGAFDFVDNAATQGGLINAQNGRIYMPVVEPFGSHLSELIRDGLPDNPAQAEALISQIVFQPLYDSTKTAAQQIPALNRFKLKGQYQSASGAEIPLNAINVPPGSVTVTAGGVRLIENQDYTVDYNLGRVRILNEGILSAGTPIKISLESNSLFNIQIKTMIGTRFDYLLTDKMRVGATVLNLRERPLTQKVNVGDEPVNNTIVGLDYNYQTESGWLTRMVDRIPLLETKAKSTVDFAAEAAYLIPGHSRAIGRDGNAYLDDFEGSVSAIDIRSINQWFLASTPQLQPDLFPEANTLFEDSLIFNYNRAKTSWYTIDPLFFRDGAPEGVDQEARSDHRMREVLESEVFPNRQLPAGTPPNTPTLDLSYFPEERGMYNYCPPVSIAESAGLNPDGTLADPESRWGGIQRALTTTDFESANIQFIQFWLMDPFNADAENSTGGDLYFNLGNVSEDVLFDSAWSFENGLPSPNNPTVETQTTAWGVIPGSSVFNVVNAFDATSGNYTQQDIGLDGLNSQAEQSFFSQYLSELAAALDPAAYSNYVEDVSADDYEYFRREGNLNTIERYKNFNGYEGNSNTASINGISQAATTIPNTEDINQDLTLSTIESYFQYKVSLRPNDLGPEDVGANYISDRLDQVVTTVDGNTRNITWYQFRIPITDFERRLGNIPDFRSIRFIRVFLKGWAEPVTLRFARLELVRGEWRPYLYSLEEPGEIEPSDPDPTTFTLAAVNIEENGNRDPIPYVIPPGIQREQDVGTANLRNLNEQSLQLTVCNLLDGDARAAYRNVNFDMRMYEKVEMFVHAEAGSELEPLNDKDVTAFIRLGSDFDDNYYEYELPLKVTQPNTSNPDLIWPEVNNMVIELKKLQNLKTSRPAGFSLLQEYIQQDGNARIKIKGNPNLANVVTVMVGVRNPDQVGNPFGSDDGQPKCAIVWVNELRLTDFNQQGGWAAIARMNAQLADFGNVSVAANMSTPGWGTLEQRIQERQQETIKGIDANSTLQLGKFFPEDAGVQIPMYLGFSETVSNPRFDPLAPDIEFDDISSGLSAEERRARQKRTQNYTKRRSINFTNVRIESKGGARGGGGKGGKAPSKDEGKGGGGKEGKKDENKPRFYDVSNFSVSYSYNEIYQRDVNTEFNSQKNYMGAVNYTFSNRPKEIKPFSNIGFIKDSKALRFIKDFNFYPGIKQVAFRTQMDRTYQTMRIRDNSAELFGVDAQVIIPTQVMKTWNWTRQYTLKYDLTKSLRFSFDANNLALVGEPQGLIDRENRDSYLAYRDSVWANIRNFGETTNYQHNTSVNYKLPLDKFPLLDFLSSDATYSASYRWDRAPFSQDTLGNTIQNSRNIQLSAQANFLTLYNKVPKLKEINDAGKNTRNTAGRGRSDEVDGFGNKIEKEEEGPKFNPFHELARLLMMVQNVSGTYQRTEGILLPGYNQKTYIAGMDPNFSAPGLGFVFGQQNTNLLGDPTGNYALDAGTNGWLVQQPNLNNQYVETFNETISGRAKLEPIKHLSVELTVNQTETRSQNSFFRWIEEESRYDFQSPMETGSFTTTLITWPTAFIQDAEDFSSETFDAFLSNRRFISERLNDEFHNYPVDSIRNNGYYTGWGPTSQDVVIPAFIAAYTGKEVSEVQLSAFNTPMQPNWRITYDGLSKIPSIKKRFKQFSVNHNYRSTMSTSYVKNLNYEADANGNPISRDQSEFSNYVADRQINTVTISEQMSPVIGVDMTLKVKNKKNKDIDPQLRVEWAKDRNISLGLTNYQITETKSNSFIVGVGYTIPEVPNPFKRRRKGSKLSAQMLENSPLNLRADLTIRDNTTIIRKMEERQNQVTAGQTVISLRTAADLSVSNKLTVRFFYDQQLTRPKISTSFPTSNINSGISLRFQLSQ